VRAFWPDGSPLGLTFQAYEGGFRGGVRVATCDVDGDGAVEIVTAPGPGRSPRVKVWKPEADGARTIASFVVDGASRDRGVFVACGDVDGDGRADVVTGLDAGGPAEVRAWSVDGRAATPLATVLAYEATFTGGTRVAVADVDGDGRAEIITAPGGGGTSEVRVLAVDTGEASQVATFSAADPGPGQAVFVGAVDVDGDGRAEVVASVDGTVTVFGVAGNTATPLVSRPPADAATRGDVPVAAGR
jgi:hypothetical protein